MSDYPQSIMVFDPGKTMGVAYVGPDFSEPVIETWKFKDAQIGACYLHFLNMVGERLKHLPDCQLGIELMTIVPHVNPKTGAAHVDAKQVQMSSGWPNMLETMVARRKLRPLHHIAIGTWRSRTHGKVSVPKNLNLKKQAERSKWLKIQAREFCDKNEWSYKSDDAAEAACMLDYMRQEYEPGYKFEAGHGGIQEALL